MKPLCKTWPLLELIVKANRSFGHRGMSFQSLEPRLAFDAEGVVSEPELEVSASEFVAMEFSVFDVNTTSVEESDLEKIAYMSAVSFDSDSETGEHFELKDVPLSEVPLENELGAEEIDAYMMRNLVDEGPVFSLDCNGDGEVAALDALMIINSLNEFMKVAGPLDSAEADLRLDVNQDGFISPLDALLVINGLNQQQLLAGQQLVESNGFAAVLSDIEDAARLAADELYVEDSTLTQSRMAGASVIALAELEGYEKAEPIYDEEGHATTLAKDDTQQDDQSITEAVWEDTVVDLADLV